MTFIADWEVFAGLPILTLLLFDPVGIPQRVQCMLARVRVGRDVPDHHRLAVPDERVLQDQGQLRASEWLVALGLVEGSDALLQGEEGFVDLGAIDPCLFVGVLDICSPLGPGEVDEGHLPHGLVAGFEVELEDRVGSRGVHIGPSAPALPNSGPDLDDLLDRVNVHGSLFGDPDDVDLLLSVHPQGQLFPLVQEVVQLAAVDLEEGDLELEVLELGLFQQGEDVLGRQHVHAGDRWTVRFAILAHHRVGLAGARLAVGEARDLGSTKRRVDQGSD